MNRRLPRILVGYLVTLWAVFLPRLLWADAALYSSPPMPRVLEGIGSLEQLAPLAAGSVFALRAAARLERGNRARLGWWLLGGWLSCFFAGEVILSTYKALGTTPPVPSSGDAFFLVGYAFLIAGAAWFVFVYAASGLPLGPAGERVVIALGAALVLSGIGWLVLAPVARAPRPVVEVLVSAGYPVLDFVVMVPTALLVRMTSRFHGGQVWTVWGSILLGFVVLAVADTGFAYSDLVGTHWLDALTTPVFATGYALTAYGAAVQSALLDGSRGR